MHIQEDQLKEFILDSGLVNRSDFEVAEKEAISKDQNVGQILISSGKLSEDDLRRIQAYILGIPFVNLKGQKIDFEILNLKSYTGAHCP